MTKKEKWLFLEDDMNATPDILALYKCFDMKRFLVIISFYIWGEIYGRFKTFTKALGRSLWSYA